MSVARVVEARVGAVGLYATSASLSAVRFTRAERATRTFLVFVGLLIITPLGFLVPPHIEPAITIFVVGLYWVRRAWVGEWQVGSFAGVCPRCTAALSLKPGSMLYLPHTVTCGDCRTECWLELEAAPVVEDAVRQEAMEKLAQPAPRGELGGRPPTTWSPASSDWRDGRRT